MGRDVNLSLIERPSETPLTNDFETLSYVKEYGAIHKAKDVRKFLPILTPPPLVRMSPNFQTPLTRTSALLFEK